VTSVDKPKATSRRAPAATAAPSPVSPYAVAAQVPDQHQVVVTTAGQNVLEGEQGEGWRVVSESASRSPGNRHHPSRNPTEQINHNPPPTLSEGCHSIRMMASLCCLKILTAAEPLWAALPDSLRRSQMRREPSAAPGGARSRLHWRLAGRVGGVEVKPASRECCTTGSNIISCTHHDSPDPHPSRSCACPACSSRRSGCRGRCRGPPRCASRGPRQSARPRRAPGGEEGRMVRTLCVCV
jgi:hypothetical protein